MRPELITLLLCLNLLHLVQPELPAAIHGANSGETQTGGMAARTCKAEIRSFESPLRFGGEKRSLFDPALLHTQCRTLGALAASLSRVELRRYSRASATGILPESGRAPPAPLS